MSGLLLIKLAWSVLCGIAITTFVLFNERAENYAQQRFAESDKGVNKVFAATISPVGAVAALISAVIMLKELLDLFDSDLGPIVKSTVSKFWYFFIVAGILWHLRTTIISRTKKILLQGYILAITIVLFSAALLDLILRSGSKKVGFVTQQLQTAPEDIEKPPVLATVVISALILAAVGAFVSREPPPATFAERMVGVPTLDIAAAPERTAAGGEWVIQIGAFASEAEARERLRTARSVGNDVLGNADPFTEKVVKGSKELYRARFVGFDRDGAEAACHHFKRNDIACVSLKI